MTVFTLAGKSKFTHAVMLVQVFLVSSVDGIVIRIASQEAGMMNQDLEAVFMTHRFLVPSFLPLVPCHF